MDSASRACDLHQPLPNVRSLNGSAFPEGECLPRRGGQFPEWRKSANHGGKNRDSVGTTNMKSPIKLRKRKVNPRGRRTKYSIKIATEICSAVARGYMTKDVAKMNGISKATLYKWLNDFPDFSDAFRWAEANRLYDLTMEIQRIGEKDWRAIAWWLERTYPEIFGKNRRTPCPHCGG